MTYWAPVKIEFIVAKILAAINAIDTSNAKSPENSIIYLDIPLTFLRKGRSVEFSEYNPSTALN